MKIEKLKKFLSLSVMSLLLLAIAFIIVNVLVYKHKMDTFKSFDLDALRRQDFIVQTIEFKKFIVQGTDVSSQSALGAYTDEVQVYHISGTAEIFFTDMESLSMNETDSDYAKKILRLNYDKKSSGAPFAVNIVVSEQNIQKVAHFESKEFSLFSIKKDLIKPDMTQSQIVAAVKAELSSEFYEQIVGTNTPTEKLEIYQTFLRQLSQSIQALSDWESVEIQIR